MTDEVMENQGVDTSEQNTEAAAPAEEQTVQEPTPEPTGEEAPEAKAEDSVSNKVPYDRFKEVNDRARILEEKLKQYEQEKAKPSLDPQLQQAREILRQAGFMTQEDFQQQIRQQKEDEQLQQTLARLESTYSGADGRPKFNRDEIIDYCLANGISNPEVGYKTLYEKELIDWHIRTASEKSRGVKSEVSDGSGKENVGTTDDDLMAAIAQGDKDARKTYFRRLARKSLGS